MNHAIKFHSPDGPAFNPGERWIGSSKHVVQIISTRRYGPDKWDVDVEYGWGERGETRTNNKDAWNFQVRYNHIADTNV